MEDKGVVITGALIIILTIVIIGCGISYAMAHKKQQVTITTERIVTLEKQLDDLSTQQTQVIIETNAVKNDVNSVKTVVSSKVDKGDLNSFLNNIKVPDYEAVADCTRVSGDDGNFILKCTSI